MAGATLTSTSPNSGIRVNTGPPKANPGQKALNTGGADMTPFLQREMSARQQFASRSAANTFAKTRDQYSGQNSVNDFRQNFQRQLPSFTADFAQRGLSGAGLQSGVMKRAMTNRVGDYTRDMGRMVQGNFDNQQQYDLNQSDFASQRDAALAQIAADKAATIANTAQQIAALRPFLGGN